MRYGPRPPVMTKPEPYRGIITARLEAYPLLSAVRLFEEVRAAGYAGGYTRLTEFVRPCPAPEPVVRFETPPGLLAQVDFAEFKFAWGKRYTLVVVLGYSCLLWLRFYERQDMCTCSQGWRRRSPSLAADLRPDEGSHHARPATGERAAAPLPTTRFPAATSVRLSPGVDTHGSTARFYGAAGRGRRADVQCSTTSGTDPGERVHPRANDRSARTHRDGARPPDPHAREAAGSGDATGVFAPRRRLPLRCVQLSDTGFQEWSADASTAGGMTWLAASSCLTMLTRSAGPP